MQLVENKDVALNVISKSGTTTEPGITFRVLRKVMEDKYGKDGAAKRIIATTDPDKGALRKLATEKGYSTFPIAPDIGGRFSVLTPVGLLPIAVAGIDISGLIDGAKEALSFCSGTEIEKNLSMKYAVNRNILFRQGKVIEVLAGFQPQFQYLCEWWKQLAGESEGKDKTGIFPAILDYTTDLHSVGQWIQDGTRNIFETFVVLKNTNTTVTIPDFTDNNDGLKYLAGSSFEKVNENAFLGTLLAHLDGGVPASVVSVEDRSPESLGQLFYFFEKTIALSGYILRVNPFNQPGVDNYKNNMFAFLSKPGFEKQGEELKTRLKELGL
jgi:glucose-6-phosphate isomerase